MCLLSPACLIRFYNSGYSTHVKQAPPTFASWLPVQISVGNQTPRLESTVFNRFVFA